MKLHILSDLHLGVQAMEPPAADADLVVLAGDITRPPKAIDWAQGFAKPVLYVAGNHEFYGSSVPATHAELARLAKGTRVTVLERRSLVLGGVRFLGTTLWTDFLAAGAQHQEEAMAGAQQFAYDFQRIQVTDAAGERLLVPQDTTAFFRDSAQWLDAELDRPFAGPTVVITHHAPSLKSIHPRFAGSPINAAFVSDAEWLLRDGRAALWIHGHTHDSFDYQVAGTRVVCNPRGYVREGKIENESFDPLLTVEVSPSGFMEI